MIKLIMTVDYENTTKRDVIRALHADRAYACIDEIKIIFRNALKYDSLPRVNGMPGSEVLNEDQINIIEKLQGLIFDICSDLPEQD